MLYTQLFDSSILKAIIGFLLDFFRYAFDHKEILVGIILCLLGLILMRMLKVHSNVELALMDDKVRVKRKDPYLDGKIEFLLKNLGHPPFCFYTVPKSVRKTFRKKHLVQQAVETLVRDILAFLHVPDNDLIVIVDRRGELKGPDENKSAAGLFVQSAGVGREIHVALLPYYTLDTVIAIACHECCHAFLEYNGVRIPDLRENEALTDTCAMYMGFSKCLLTGYKPIKRISDVSYTHDSVATTISSNTIGYLNLSQLTYIDRKLKKLKKKIKREEKAEKRRAEREVRKSQKLADKEVKEVEKQVEKLKKLAREQGRVTDDDFKSQ